MCLCGVLFFIVIIIRLGLFLYILSFLVPRIGYGRNLRPLRRRIYWPIGMRVGRRTRNKTTRTVQCVGRVGEIRRRRRRRKKKKRKWVLDVALNSSRTSYNFSRHQSLFVFFFFYFIFISFSFHSFLFSSVITSKSRAPYSRSVFPSSASLLLLLVQRSPTWTGQDRGGPNGVPTSHLPLTPYELFRQP